jgi:hypothetical protein
LQTLVATGRLNTAPSNPQSPIIQLRTKPKDIQDETRYQYS